jgi:N-acetylglutamate synthase-like GNAT family acetyltransferase
MAEWFYAEWSSMYEDMEIDDVKRRIGSRLHYDKIPLAIIAMQGPTMIGTVSLKESDMETHPELAPWLAGLYVAEKHRERGVGKLLVDNIIAIAAKLGLSRLFLFTPKQEQFYKNQGWELLAREMYHTHEVSIMAKNILPSLSDCSPSAEQSPA